jgi:hypothetical protein
MKKIGFTTGIVALLISCVAHHAMIALVFHNLKVEQRQHHIQYDKYNVSMVVVNAYLRPPSSITEH